MIDIPYSQALVEPGCVPGPEDWSESHIILGNRVFIHRGERYAIDEDIPLSIAHLICKAQWIEADNRLDHAHKLFVAWMQHDEIHGENDWDETDDEQILQGTKPPGISLAFLNKMLRCIGFVLVISIDIDKDGRLTGTNTRLWMERIKKYEARVND